MNKQEILTKAIREAIANGWQATNWTTVMWLPKDYPKNIAESVIGMHRVNELIFNHDFAKALWGEKPILIREGSKIYMDPRIPAWHSHLRAMVIADDPIKYLEDNLPT